MPKNKLLISGHRSPQQITSQPGPFLMNIYFNSKCQAPKISHRRRPLHILKVLKFIKLKIPYYLSKRHAPTQRPETRYFFAFAMYFYFFLDLSQHKFCGCLFKIFSILCEFYGVSENAMKPIHDTFQACVISLKENNCVLYCTILMFNI